MNPHGDLKLRDSLMTPTDELLALVLGDSYTAYKALQDALPKLDMKQVWQWYTPYKAWFARGQHFWTTKRGTEKEKTLYWLYVYDGYFSMVVWFKEKNRTALLASDFSEQAKLLISNAETMGKLPTFPVSLDITAPELLAEVYALLDCKKRLER